LVEKERVFANLAVILTDDILTTLMKKDVFSKITVTVAVPDDKVLSEGLGLDLESFDALENVKTRTMTYKIVGKRNNTMFKSGNNFVEFITELRTKFGDNLKGLSASAKDLAESSQNYDLLQYNFTKKVSIGEEDEEMVSFDKFKEALETTYNLNKAELLKYIRI